MGNICYGEQNDAPDAPRDFPPQFDISVPTINGKICNHCEFFKKIDFKYALQLFNIEGLEEKIKTFVQIPIPKYHKYLKVQGQIRFLPECGDREFDEIQAFQQPTQKDFSYPLAILVKSIIIDVTTSWFQRYLGQPRMKANYELQKRNQFLYYNKKIQDIQLSDAEQLLVFYLRWGVSFEKFKFITYELIQNDYLRFIYDNLKLMFHLALTLNIIINQYQYKNRNQNDPEFLLIYSVISEQYNIIMWSMQQEYDFCGDGLMEMYYKYFETGDQRPTSPEDRMPHFKLISIYQRYWCQRVMNSVFQGGQKIINRVINSFNIQIQNLRDKDRRNISDFEIKLLRVAFSQILDCSVNEISVHWLGHQKFDCKNEYLGELISVLQQRTIQYYQERLGMDLKSYSLFLDQDLNLMRQIFPEWIITHFIEGIGILKKAEKVKDLLNLDYRLQLENIKNISFEDINKEFIEAVRTEAEKIYLRQKEKQTGAQQIFGDSQQLQQEEQQLPEIIEIQQSVEFTKMIIQKISQIKKRSKVEKTALFLDSLSRIQGNKSDIGQQTTTGFIQNNQLFTDLTTGPTDPKEKEGADKQFKVNLGSTFIQDLLEPSQQSQDFANELEKKNEDILTYIEELDRQQK
ncbi:hypothetical protein pb186bvf_006872 [Paramecium bursaria]